MCGILGVFNGTKTNIKEFMGFMRDGCKTGILRGDDSTGMFQYRKDEYDIAKLPISGEMFVKTKAADGLMYHVDEPGFTVLHHRAATRGTVSFDNCHPFEHNYEGSNRFVVGVHNGTLSQAWSRDGDMTFDVDSDFLMYKIYKDGAAKALGHINGSYACVWMEEDGKLRIATNGERSIYFGFVKGKNAMMIASEAGMLWWLATRNGVEVETIVAPTKDLIHTFHEDDLRKFTTQELEKKPAIFTPAPRASAWESRGNITTGANTQPRGETNDRLKALGVAFGEVLNFYPEGDPTLGATSVAGYVDVGNGSDFVKAVIYGATPPVIEALLAAKLGCIEVPVKGVTKTSSRKPDGTFGELEDTVVCGTPVASCCVLDPTDMGNAEELPNVSYVPGPNGRMIPLAKFIHLTEDGCMQCGVPIQVKDAADVGWVNSDKNALCPACKEEIKEMLA